VRDTVFVVGGGPSVAGQNIELLRGRKVIAINSSFAVAPFADALFFGDGRWWNLNRRAVLDGFKGQIVTVAEESMGDEEAAPRLRLLKKTLEWSDNPEAAFVRRTSVTGAINWAFHHWPARRFVLLGVDGGPVKGATHHHKPHPWQIPSTWVGDQRRDFEALDVALKARGAEVINASPGSSVPFWPVMSLEDYLATETVSA
jgi:hypothetical protein